MAPRWSWNAGRWNCWRTAETWSVKDGILDPIWAERDVSDASLVHCVARPRRALGADGRGAIRTVHGYGYWFDGALRVEVADTQAVTLAEGDIVAG